MNPDDQTPPTTNTMNAEQSLGTTSTTAVADDVHPVDNPVAMTHVGEPDLVSEHQQQQQQQEDPKQHDQPVDLEQGDIAQAATSAPAAGAEDVEMETTQPVVIEEPVAAQTIENTVPLVEETTIQSIEPQEEAGAAVTAPATATATDNQVQTSHDDAKPEETTPTIPAEDAVVEPQTSTQADLETNEPKDIPVDDLAAKSAPQSDVDADDLFGSDDNDDDNNNDLVQNKPAKSIADTDSVVEALSPARDSARQPAQQGSADEDDNEGEDDNDEDEEDEDMPRRKKRRGESSVSGGDDDDDGEEEAVIREERSLADGEEGVKQESRRGGGPDDEDDDERTAEPEETDEAFARKRALDARIEAIGKAGKRKRSRKKDDSEDLGLDRQIEEMTTMMDNAIRSDIDMNKSRKPALSKTQILNRVIAVLQNASLQQSILESNDFLSTLRRFIEPMEDGSLPSLTIQKGILFQLGRLEGLEVIHLRNSGLGKVVNFYTRCKSCQPEIIRQANLLIDRWSKPILDTGNNARASARARAAEAEREDQDDRHHHHHHTAEGGERGEGAGGGASNGESGGGGGGGRPKDRKTAAMRSGALLYQKVQADKEKGDDKQKSSRLPSHIGHAYAVAPTARRSAKGPEEQAMEEARQREAERINRFKKKAMQASR